MGGGKDNQCEKLWQDIEDFVKNQKDSIYFFGSIIINNNDEKLYIIDGLQRLSTFLLLLKALLIRIEEKIPQTNDEESRAIKQALQKRRAEILTALYDVENIDEIGEMTSFRDLQARYGDLAIKYKNESVNENFADDMHAILQSDNFDEIKNKGRGSNFFKNFKYFYDKLGDFGESNINSFANTFLNKCQIVVIISFNEEEAIEIFHSLNSTGMPLSDVDIISAILYKNSDDKGDFKSQWKNITRNIKDLESKKIKIGDILNQYMYILRAKDGISDTTIPGARKYFTNANKAILGNPRKFIDDFDRIISIWRLEDSNKEILNLTYILLNLNDNFRYFYATYFFANSDKSDDEKIKFIKALVKLFALLDIFGIGYTSRKSPRYLLISKINPMLTNESIAKIVGDMDKHIKDNFGRDEAWYKILASNATSGLVYLNEYLFAQEYKCDLDLSNDHINIEHIMPSSGKDIDSIRQDAFMSGDDFKKYVNKIGNKILLEEKINKSLGKAWFQTKKSKTIKEKRGYKDSSFPIAKSLVKYKQDIWGKDDIDEASLKATERIIKFIFD